MLQKALGMYHFHPNAIVADKFVDTEINNTIKELLPKSEKRRTKRRTKTVTREEKGFKRRLIKSTPVIKINGTLSTALKNVLIHIQRASSSAMLVKRSIIKSVRIERT